jgi:hypothetical protein
MRPSRLLLALAALLLLVAVGTWAAGELHEVAVLRTVDAEGQIHETKLWVVDLDGAPWVRVARRGRRWLARIEAHPEVVLVRDGVAVPHRATVITEPEVRQRVDRAFAQKYGWVDRWYGLVLRRDPVPVRLDPMVAGPREAEGP